MGWEEDYRAFGESCAMADLPWAKLRFTGPDRRKFLNGLLTNDVAGLAARGGFACCLLTPKGLLRAHFLLYDAGEAFMAFCPAESAGNLLSVMAQMIMLSESKVEDLTAELGLVYLAGPRTGRVLREALGAAASLEAFEASLLGGGLMLMSWPRLAEQGRLLAFPADRSPDIRGRLSGAGARTACAEAFNVLRIEAGYPLFGVDMGEDAIPLEARLEDAISFDKGCYMGQETISRVRNLGHLNRVLVRLKVSAAEPPAPGSAVLRDGKQVGVLTSAAVSPRAGAILALATVRVESSGAGTVLGVASGRGSHRAEVVAF